jgi:hypothetical protein
MIYALLPCPFAKCGGEAENNYDRGSECWNVACEKCGTQSDDCETAQAAADWWNDRNCHASPPIAPAQDEIEFIADKILGAALERKCPYARKSESGQVFFVRYYFAGHVNIESDRKTVKDWLVASLRAGHTYND